jgi:hypothetical protein
LSPTRIRAENSLTRDTRQQSTVVRQGRKSSQLMPLTAHFSRFENSFPRSVRQSMVIPTAGIRHQPNVSWQGPTTNMAGAWMTGTTVEISRNSPKWLHRCRLHAVLSSPEALQR